MSEVCSVEGCANWANKTALVPCYADGIAACLEVYLCDWHRDMRILSADAVWATLEAQPGFNEELRQARCDIESGHGTYLSEIQRP